MFSFKKKHQSISSLILQANTKMGHTVFGAKRDAERLAKQTGCDVQVADRGVYVYYKGNGETQTVDFWPKDQ